jgi:hypothetical protein
MHLPLASFDHSRSASCTRLSALVPASQPNAAALLVLVAALPSVSSQLLSYPTSYDEEMTPSSLSLLHSGEKYR